jgi:S1-C subfamily serine protease
MRMRTTFTISASGLSVSGLRWMLLAPVFAAALFAPCACAAAESAAGQRGPVHAQQPYLGIVFVDLNEDQTAALHVKGGVEIVLVDHEAPAGKIDLRPHDVIVHANGQPVPNSEALRRIIHDAGEGKQLSLDVIRQSKLLTLTTQLESRDEVEREALKHRAALNQMTETPDPLMDDPMPPTTLGEGFLKQVTPPPAKQSFLASMLHTTPFTGLAMDEMEPQLATFFGAPDGVGLLVNTVLPNSPAASAGLRAGDVVLKADAVSLRSVTDWTRYLHATRGRTITLTVLREKQSQVVTLLPELKKHSMVEWPRFF